MNELTPRQRRHLRTRDAILDAARQIIAEDGADNLSMRGIAERIDYSAAGLYEYFGGKDEIITAVCMQGEERLYQKMINVDTSLPPLEYLIELGLGYIDFALNNADHFKLMFASEIEPSEEIQDTFREKSSFGILVGAIQRGIDEGVFITREGFGLMDMAYLAWAIVHGVAALRITRLSVIPYDFGVADREVLRTTVFGLTQSL